MLLSRKIEETETFSFVFSSLFFRETRPEHKKSVVVVVVGIVVDNLHLIMGVSVSIVVVVVVSAKIVPACGFDF